MFRNEPPNERRPSGGDLLEELGETTLAAVDDQPQGKDDQRGPDDPGRCVSSYEQDHPEDPQKGHIQDVLEPLQPDEQGSSVGGSSVVALAWASVPE